MNVKINNINKVIVKTLFSNSEYLHSAIYDGKNNC